MKAQPDKRDRQRYEDSARVLPLFGIFLLVSPILNALIGIETVLGAPIAYLYIFAAWAVLIMLTARLSRKLTDETQDRAEP